MAQSSSAHAAAPSAAAVAFDRRSCTLKRGSARRGHVAAVVVVTCNRPDYLRLAMKSVLEVHGKDKANRCVAAGSGSRTCFNWN